MINFRTNITFAVKKFSKLLLFSNTFYHREKVMKYCSILTDPPNMIMSITHIHIYV